MRVQRIRWESSTLKNSIAVVPIFLILSRSTNPLECDFANASEWSYCLSLPDAKCVADDTAVCDARCKWVRCSFKNRKKNEVEKLVSRCVPFTTIRKDDFCEDFEGLYSLLKLCFMDFIV